MSPTRLRLHPQRADATALRVGARQRLALTWILLALCLDPLGCSSMSPGPGGSDPVAPGTAGARLGISGTRAPRELVPIITRSIQETHEASFASSRVTGRVDARFVQQRDYAGRSPGFAEYWIVKTTEGIAGYWVFFTGHNRLDGSVSTFPDTSAPGEQNDFLLRFDLQEGRSSARTWRPDGLSWILVKSYVGDGHARFEYVTADERDASEATYLLIETLTTDVSVGHYAERMNRGIQRVCPNTTHETLAQDPDQILIEWHAPRCGKATTEHGLMRIVDSGRVLHKLIFVQKTEKMKDGTRDLAIQLISSAEVADPLEPTGSLE